MESGVLGTVILWLIVVIVAAVIVIYALRWLYRRSTKETSFVRTGFLGEKVVINGGALVIPVIHDVTPVHMGVLRIEVRRGDGQALITKDRMRVDVSAEFYVRVAPRRDAVAAAAQTLGARTTDVDEMRGLLEGKFIGGLRGVAASMTLEDLHEQRTAFADQVKQAVEPMLAHNGLELESVAMVDVDQTSLEFFDPSNAFDAEGLTALTERIESRRKLRNDIEQGTMLQIRARNLETDRSVLEIDRESEYARLEQEREVEVRRAVQRAELIRERAQREQEGEQAQIAARELVEKTRIAHERTLADTRIVNEEETQRQEIARRRAVEAAEIQAEQQTEQERIAAELALERERIARAQAQEELEITRRRSVEIAEQEREKALAANSVEVIAADTKKREAEVASRMDLDLAGVRRDQALDRARVEREKTLEAMEVSKRQAFQEAEIGAEEDVERARLASERSLREARILLDRDLRTLEIERQQANELAEVERAIALAEKSKARSAALVDAEKARAEAIAAEEQAFTAREREIAERRKAIDLIAAAREAEIERLRLTARAEAEQVAAADRAEAERIVAAGDADAQKIRADAAKHQFTVDAAGAKALNEAENLLSEAARAGRLRDKLLDKLEGIVRESVRPMEKIEGIKILHVDGLAGGGGAGGSKNVTDEVIDSALRYRVQAPMIDNLMKEVGIEGGSVGRLTDVVRDARDLASLTRGESKDREREDTDRDRDDRRSGSDE